MSSAPAPAIDDSPIARPPRGRRSARHSVDRRGPLRWAGPLIVLIVAAVARLSTLGSPKVLMFDETYYVKDAWSLWKLGHEGTWDTLHLPKGFTAAPPDPNNDTRINDAFQAGHVNFFTSQAEYAAHPPLGKWIIGLGEELAGGAGNSFGWRLSVAVVGILAVALVMVIAHRMFRNAFITTLAGGLMAIDNQAILMSRIGLLDNMIMFFALAAFACLVEDRFWVERRYGRWLMRRTDGSPGVFGPTVIWRPWLLAVGVLCGLCAGVKWSGLYFLVFFVLYSVLSDAMLRRRTGIRFWYFATVLKQLLVTLFLTVPIAVLSYLACWTGYFVTSGGYDRSYIADGGAKFTGLLAWVPAPIQDLWQWHVSIYTFHITLDQPHNYSAPAILWPLIARPTSMYWDTASQSGGSGCQFGSCAAAITDLPNPLIWYAAVAATIYLLVRFIRYREWQPGMLLIGVAAGYLPWLAFPKRTIFFFYTIAFEPYMLICLAATIGLMVMRPPTRDTDDEIDLAEAHHGLRIRRRVVAVFVVAAVALSLFFYPLDTGMQTPYWFWQIHMWSPTWI